MRSLVPKFDLYTQLMNQSQIMRNTKNFAYNFFYLSGWAENANTSDSHWISERFLGKTSVYSVTNLNSISHYTQELMSKGGSAPFQCPSV